MDNSRSFEQAYKATISDSDFRRLAAHIEKSSGIKMPPEKKVMLQSRLKKRLYQLGMNDFKTYCDYVFSPESSGHETLFLLNFISTNKTDFFREPVHYTFLEEEVLPDFAKRRNKMHVWSAGCSSGEEVYSLAILLAEAAMKNLELDYEVLGTDISTPMLEKAVRAEYREQSITEIPLNLRKRYFLRHKDASKSQVRVGPALRSKVRFRYLNFMDYSYDLPRNFDVIFFRNVLIYFNKEIQEQVLGRIVMHLEAGGYLFIGHSENILNFDLPLEKCGPNVFRKTNY